MPVFKDQYLLTIELDTGYDISAATSVKILYQKPGGTKGEWVGSVSDTTKITYSVQEGDLDTAGTWILQAYAVVGSKVGYGAYAYMDVDPNLD